MEICITKNSLYITLWELKILAYIWFHSLSLIAQLVKYRSYLQTLTVSLIDARKPALFFPIIGDPPFLTHQSGGFWFIEECVSPEFSRWALIMASWSIFIAGVAVSTSIYSSGPSPRPRRTQKIEAVFMRASLAVCYATAAWLPANAMGSLFDVCWKGRVSITSCRPGEGLHHGSCGYIPFINLSPCHLHIILSLPDLQHSTAWIYTPPSDRITFVQLSFPGKP